MDEEEDRPDPRRGWLPDFLVSQGQLQPHWKIEPSAERGEGAHKATPVRAWLPLSLGRVPGLWAVGCVHAGVDRRTVQTHREFEFIWAKLTIVVRPDLEGLPTTLQRRAS